MVKEVGVDFGDEEEQTEPEEYELDNIDDEGQEESIEKDKEEDIAIFKAIVNRENKRAKTSNVGRSR